MRNNKFGNCPALQICKSCKIKRYFSKSKACKGNNNRRSKDSFQTSFNELHEKPMEEVNLNTLHTDFILLISEERTGLSLGKVDSELPSLMLNIAGIKVISIIGTGSRYNIISTALARKLDLYVTATGEIETLQLLQSFLIKVLSRIQISIMVDKKEVMMFFAPNNKSFNYMILSREGLDKLSTNWNKHRAAIIGKSNDVSVQKGLLTDNKEIHHYSKLSTANQVLTEQLIISNKVLVK